MRAPTQLRSGEARFNMTPMIDVVFLLIIFFLVSSHLARQEALMPLDLPEAASGRESQPAEKRVVINVQRDGTLWFAGRIVPAESLAERLRTTRAEHGEELEVAIRGDHDTLCARVHPVLAACAAQKIWNITFSVYPASD